MTDERVPEEGTQRPQRRGPDPLLRVLPWVCGLGWLLLVAAVYCGASGKPEPETVIERWHGREVRTAWDLARMHCMFRLAVGGVSLSLVGMVINSRRLKRKGDEFRVNLCLLCSASVALLFWYFAVV